MNGPIRKLGDVCNLLNGFAFKSKDYVDSSNTLNIRMSNIRPDGTFNPDHNIRFLPDAYVHQYPQFLLADGDLVIAMTDMAGDPKILGLPTLVRNLNGRQFLLNQRVGKLFDFTDEVYIPYLRHYLSSPIIKEYYKTKGAGGLQINISKRDVLSADIFLPPLPEQKRIVALLDSAFADIDKARATAAKNLKNARELFESFLSQTFSASGPSAKNTNLGNEINLLTGFAFKSPEYSKSKSDTPLIRGDNIIQGKLRWDDAKYWPSDKVSGYEKYFLDENDIVLAMDRTWVKSGMKYAKISPADLPCLLVQRVARLRCKAGILHDYLYYLIGSKKFEAYVLSIQTGLGVPHISGKQIQAFTFTLPSIEVQAETVGQFSNIHKLTTDLISIYESKISNLEELKKSLLHKAFTGQLSASATKAATDGQAA